MTIYDPATGALEAGPANQAQFNEYYGAATPHLHNSEEAATYYANLLDQCREWIKTARNDYDNHFGARNNVVASATALIDKIDRAQKAWR